MVIKEFEKKFSTNKYRAQLIDKFREEVETIQFYIDPLRVVVFGSFIYDDVPVPNDIDVLAHGMVIPSRRIDYMKNGVNSKYPKEIQIQRSFKLQPEGSFRLDLAREMIFNFNKEQLVNAADRFIKKNIEVEF